MKNLRKRLFQNALRVHKSLRKSVPYYAVGYGHLKSQVRKRLPGKGRRKSPYDRSASIFSNHYHDSPLRPKLILYESFHGSSVACHPAALYEAAQSDPRFAGFQHVWVLDDPDALPPKLAAQDNTTTITRASADYPEILATAQYVINNSTFPPWYIRREGQVYLNTWHGTPLKTMFADETGMQARFANSQRNFLQASHIIMSSDFATEHLLGPAQIAPLCRAKTWQIGTPRVDRTLRIRNDWSPAAAHRHILFAPTWKGTIGSSRSQQDEIAEVTRIVGETAQVKTTLHIKVHNFNKEDLHAVNQQASDLVTIETVHAHDDINDVMARMDVVITDYSSLLFDALAADIPVILHTPDLEDYKKERGLYIDLTTLPLAICYDEAALRAALKAPRPASAYPQADETRARYYPDDDGKAAGRVLDVLLKAEGALAPLPHTPKPVLALMAGGWKKNGITTSALNLLSNIDYTTYDVVVLTDGAKMPKEAWPQLAKAHPAVMFIHRVGAEGFTDDEVPVKTLFYQLNKLTSEDQIALMQRAMAREGRRLVGDVQFQAAIEFSGYRRLWVWIMAMLPASQKIIFQHNDMHSEMCKRFASLLGVFFTYRYYDQIVSVSEETRRLNAENLLDFYGDANSRAIRNSLNISAILAAGDRPLGEVIAGGKPHVVIRDAENTNVDYTTFTTIPAIDTVKTNFITLGRCSDEKNHAMLLEAFSALVQKRKDVHLYILGEGPLLRQTRALRDRLGLQDYVTIPGFSDYALGLVSACDCFVLPSLYEGQPMVILEALTLGKPVITTDIPGSRSALSGGFGHIVKGPVSAEPFAAAMSAFCDGKLTFKRFDAEAYNKVVVSDFHAMISNNRGGST